MKRDDKLIYMLLAIFVGFVIGHGLWAYCRSVSPSFNNYVSGRR